MTRNYDLIIFGATGYTGEWVVEECANLQKPDSGIKPFTWAVAGRTERKLIETLRKVSEYTGVDVSNVDRILADVSDYDSLRRMAAQGNVIVNCVGPYRFYGEAVVKACLAEGASHVDLSGELQFLEKMQIVYHNEAEEKGIYIVGACGYDSVPGDCGVVYLQQTFDGEINAIECYTETDSHGRPAGLHFGTWQSAIHFIANYGELKELSKQLYTVAIPPPKYKVPWRFPLHYSKVVNGWCLPFPGVDEAIVKRSQYYFYTKEKKRPVQYKAYMKMPNLVFCIGAMIVGLFLGVLSQFKFGRYLLETYPKVFSLGLASHEGPTREDADAIDFKFTMFAEGWKERLSEPTDQHASAPDKKAKLVVAGKNPGYRATAAMLVQSALTIVQESDKMPSTGGVYPPGAAFARTTIVDRCGQRGVRFSVEK